MKFCVVGPGAMGCLFAAYFQQAGFDVALLDHRPDRAALIASSGIVVEGVRGRHEVPVRVISDPTEADRPDAVLVCVKSYDTFEAGKTLRQIIDDDTPVITVQNGLGNVDALLQSLGGKGRIVAGITSQGATVLGPGHVRHAGEGDTFLGAASADSGDSLDKLLSCFDKAGFPASAVENIQDLIWSKLIVNVGINALTALTRLKNGEIAHHDGTLALMDHAVREAVALTEALGIRLVYSDPLGQVKKVAELTSGNVSSMLQDVLRNKRTEIDFINGAIVRQGEALGIPTPVNEFLTHLVRTMQETYDLQVTI